VEYRRALELYSDSEGRSKAYSNLATLAIGRGRFREAITLLDRALAEESAYPAALFNRSSAELKLAQGVSGPESQALLRRGLADLAEALRMNPRCRWTKTQ
jgi:tetratricopeptide (TPR) repeat protein